MNKIYTSGEVAKLCGVGQRTVAKWFDSGMLEGFRIPDSKHRRFTRDAVIAFMQKHNIPIPRELQ